MFLKVKVKPNSKTASIEKKSQDSYLIMVKEKPKQGQANQVMIGLLAKHLNLPIAKLKIIKGAKTRNKIVNVITDL